MKHCNAGIAVEEKIASDVKFFTIYKKRFNVMLDKAVLLQIAILCLCLGFFFICRV